jgi:hypothetical protein
MVMEKKARCRGKGAGVLIHSAQREQGFAMQVCGEPGREIVDFEGLTLIRFPQ